MVFFNFLNFFLFFWNFLERVKQKRNGTIIFIFSPSQPFPTYFGLKWIHNGIFWIFFGIFYCASGRNKMKRKFLFSLYFNLFHPILDSNEDMIVFFNFLSFTAFFLEFSITCQVGTKRSVNFYFLSFSAFSNLFWLKMNP